MDAIHHLHKTYCPNISPEVLNTASTIFKITAVASVIFAIIMESAWLLVASAVAFSFAILTLEPEPDPIPPLPPPPLPPKRDTGAGRKGHATPDNPVPPPLHPKAGNGVGPHNEVPDAPLPPPHGSASGKRRATTIPTPPEPPPLFGNADNPFAVVLPPLQHTHRPSQKPEGTMGMSMMQQLHQTLEARKAKRQGFDHLRSPSAPNLHKLVQEPDKARPRKLDFSTMMKTPARPGLKPPGMSHTDALMAAIRARKPPSPLAEIPPYTPAAKRSQVENTPMMAPPAKPPGTLKPPAKNVPAFVPPAGLAAQLAAAVLKRKPMTPGKLPRNHSSPHLVKDAVAQPARPGRLKLSIGGSLFDAIRANRKDSPSSPGHVAQPLPEQVAVDDTSATVAVAAVKVPTPPPFPSFVVLGGIPIPPPVPPSTDRRRHSTTEIDQLELVGALRADAGQEEPDDHHLTVPAASFQTPAPAGTSSIWTPQTRQALFTDRRKAIEGSASSLLPDDTSEMSDFDAPPSRQVTFGTGADEQNAEEPAGDRVLSPVPFARPHLLNALDLETPARPARTAIFGDNNILLTAARTALRKVETAQPPKPAVPATVKPPKPPKNDTDEFSESEAESDDELTFAERLELVKRHFKTPAPKKGGQGQGAQPPK